MEYEKQEGINLQDEILMRPRASRDLNLSDGYLVAFGRIKILANSHEIKREEGLEEESS